MDIPAFISGFSWTTCFLSIILVMIAYAYLSRRPWINLPPGPPAVPILGSLPFMASPDPRIAYRHFRQKYGDIFTMHLGAETFIVVNGIKLINEVYKEKGHIFSARPDNYFVQCVFRHSGLAGTSGERWKINRLLTMKYMKALGYGSSKMEEMILAQVDDLLDEIKSFGEQTPTHVLPVFMRASYKVVSDLALGRVFADDDPKLHDFLEMVRHTLQSFNNQFSLFPYLRFLPGDCFGLKKNARQIDALLELCKSLVEDRKRDLLAGADEPYDVIGMYYHDMAKIREEGSRGGDVISDHDMVHIMYALYLAGTDTVAVTMTWLMLFMVLHPDAQEKVYAEINDVIGSARPRSADHLRLPYTSAVISETQRLSDMVPCPAPHAATEDTTLGGYTIPKGMPILSWFTSLTTDPNVWLEPNKFRPERFLDEQGAYTAKPEHYPYGKGPRNCVGEALAKAELFLMFVSLTQRFRFSLPDGATVPSTNTSFGLVVCPSDFEVIVKERA